MDAGTAVAMLTLDVGGFVGGLNGALTAAETAFGSMSATAAQKTQALGASMAVTGNLLTKTLTTPIVGAATNVFKVGSAFEQTMDTVAAVSRTPGQSLKELQANTDMLRDKALELGSSTFFSAQEVADGMIIMSKAGWDAQGIMDGMGGVLDAASASGEELATVSEVVVNGLTAFGLGAEHASDMADLMTQSANSGTHDIIDLGQSLKYAGPVAHALGMNVTDVTAALTMMSTAGIKGSQAGTSLRRILLNMVNPTEKQAAAMERLGISVADENGNFKSLDTILREVRSSTKNWTGTSEELQATLQTLAGAYGISGLNAIVNLTDEEFNKISEDMKYSGGVAKETAEIMRDNVAGAWDEFKDKIETIKIRLFDAIAPTLKNILNSLNDFLEGLSNKITPGLGKFVAALAGAAAAVGPALTAFGMLASIDSRLNGPITHVVGLVSNIQDHFAKLVPGIAQATSGVGAVVKSVGNNFANIIPITRAASKGAVGNFKDMVKGFTTNVKTVANIPNRIGRSFQSFGRIVTGSFRSPMEFMKTIGKDTATSMELIEGRMKTLQPTFKSTFDTLKSTASNAWGKVTSGLSGFNFQNKVFLGRVGEAWRKAFSNGGPIMQSVGNFGKSAIKHFARIPDGVGKATKGIFNVYKDAFSQSRWSEVSGNFVKGLTAIPRGITSVVKDSVSGIKSQYSDSFKYMAEGFSQNFPRLSKALSGFTRDFGNAWKQAGSVAIGNIKQIIPSVRGAFSEGFSQISQTLEPHMGRVKALFGEVANGISSTFGPAFNTVSSMGTKAFTLVGSIGKVAFGGTIVAAIALCIAAFVHLMNTNERFAEAIHNVGERFGAAFEKVRFVLGQIGGYLKPVFDQIKQMFDEFANSAAPLLLQIFQGLATRFEEFANNLSSNLEGPLNAVKSTIQSLLPVFQGVFTTALGLLQMVVGFVRGDFTTVWDGAKQIIDGFSQVLTGLAETADGIVRSALEGIANLLRDLGLDAAADAVDNAAQHFTLFSDVLEFVKEKVSEWGQRLGEIFQQVAQKAQEIGEKIKPALDTIIPVLVNIAGIVGGVFMAAWSAAFSTIGNIVVRVIGTIAGVLGGIGNVIAGIANIVAGVWNVVSNVVLAIVSLITGDLQGAADHMGQAFDGAKQVVDGAMGAMGGAVEAFTSLVSGAFGFVGDIVGGVGDFIGGAIDNVVGWFTDAGDSAGEMADKTGTAMGSFEEYVASAERSAEALAGGAGDAMAEMGLTAEDMSQKAGGSFNALAESSEDASGRIQLTTDEAKKNIAQFALESGMSVDELAQATGIAAEDISAAIEGIPTSADSSFGDLSSILGESGFDWSQYTSGLGADTGVATASFEEMGAALDQLSIGSTQAAQVVSESFGSVATSVTESIANATQGFTTFGETANTTFTQAATMVTEFANNTNQALSSFGENAVAAFSNMTNGITQVLGNLPSQVTASLAGTTAVILQWAGQLLNALQQAFQGIVQITTASFSQFTQIVANAMNAATQSVNMFGSAVTAVGNAVQQSIGATFTVVAQVVASSCLQMINSVVNFTQTVNNAVTAMCAQLVARINAGFTSMSSTVRAQLNQMQAAVTQFGARATSIMTSAMSRCRSAVQSGMTAMNSTMRSQLSQMIAAVTQFGARAASTMKTAMAQILASVKSGCQQTTSELQRNTQQWLNALTRFAGEARQRAASAGQNIKSGLISSLNGLSSQMYSLGLQAANGMANGIRAGSGGVIAAMQSIANAAVAAAKNSLKVASPSRVMRDEVGYWLPAGIAEGITENADIVTYAMTDLAKNLIALSQDTTADWTEESKKQLTAFGESIKSSITKVGERLTKTWTDYFEQQLNENTDNQNAVYREMARIENDYHKRIERAKDKNAKDALEAERSRLLEAQEERLATLQSQREEIQKQYDETSKDVAKFGTDVIDKFSEAMSKVADDAATEITEKFQKISEAAQEALEEVNKKIETMTSKLQDYGELLTKQSDEETGDYWQLNSLQEQINALEKYGNNLEAIKGKVSETLLSEIVAMDVEQATHYTDLLLSLTDEKLSEYNALYERKQQLAADIANKFYADQIQQVKDNYLKELVNAYLETFEQIGEIGKDTAAAFMENFDMEGFSDEYKLLAAQFEKGIADELGNSDLFKGAAAKLTGNISETLAESFDGATQEIVRRLLGLNDDIADAVDLSDAGAEAGEEFAQALYIQTTEELGIHSPSTVFASLGQDTGQGFINGIMAVLTSGKPFEIFAEALKVALDEFVSTLQVSGTDEIMPKVAELVEKVRTEVIALITYLTDSIRLFFGDVKGMLSELLALVTSTLPQFLSFAQQLAAGNDSIASSARSAASALRDQAAAVRELAAAQAAAATAEGVSVTGGGTTGVPVGNVTNNYSTTINSPVKVSAVEAMQAANRNMRSLAEGF